MLIITFNFKILNNYKNHNRSLISILRNFFKFFRAIAMLQDAVMLLLLLHTPKVITLLFRNKFKYELNDSEEFLLASKQKLF